jgi:broad specificity phosphatase PhoE
MLRPMPLLAALAVLPFLPTASLRADDAPKSYPAHILIIRHAEKPPANENSADLNAAGMARAEALAKLFARSDDRTTPFPAPDFLFATKESKKSRRPVETIAPLAKDLGLKINNDYDDEDFAKLANELFHDPKYAGKTVLICWHHKTLPEAAAKLGAVGAPETWNSEVFDRVWQVDYAKDGKATFTDRPQQLMPKDSRK